jgi:predicted ATPase
MDKHQVMYSMTIYKKQGVNQIVINKKKENDWFILLFSVKDNLVLKNKDFDQYDLLFSDDYLLPNELIETKINQNIMLLISFCNKEINNISNIIPKIDEIAIKNKSILFSDPNLIGKFSAVYKNKPKYIRTKNDDFEYYDLVLDHSTKKSTGIDGKTVTKFLKLKGLKLNHFLPKSFILLFDIHKYLKNNIINSFFDDFLSKNYQFDNQSVQNFNKKINDLSKLINVSTIDKKIDISHCTISDDIFITNKNIFKKYVKLSISRLRKMGNIILYNLYKLYSLTSTESEKKLDINFTHTAKQISVGPVLQTSIDSIINFFQKRIFYIGPLREEPRLQYNTIADSIIDIDSKGDNLPNIFFQDKDKIINHIEPNDKNMVIKKCKLCEAINKWIKYIGIAESIDVKFKGRYGYEVKILSLDKKTSNDLTNVGVGVSQVLPIVLDCLLVPEESTIIIEQPELHLHPAMQSRLTDFFIATILCKKQLIIETHSEYIINRLRLRAINWPNEKPIDGSVKIYFTENLQEDYKDYKKGNTIFKPLKINEYAAMSDWPEGFFDESSKTAKEIMNEVIKKVEARGKND